MKISILITAFNSEKYLAQCLESIFYQSYYNYEIVLIDDGSSDSTSEIIKNYLIKYPDKIKYIKNIQNSGVGFSKKEAIIRAEGDICGFLDADDFLEPHALKVIVNEFKKNEVDVVYSQFYLYNEFLNVKRIFSNTCRIPYKDRMFFNTNFEVAHFFCFKKEVYMKTAGINEILESVVDQDLYLKLYEISRFKFLKKPLYNYRIHSNGISQNKNKKELLYRNWHTVLKDTLIRRAISSLYGKNINDIDSLPEFIIQKERMLWRKVYRKFNL